MKQETVNKLPNWDSMIDKTIQCTKYLTSEILRLTRPKDPQCPPLTGVVVTLPTCEAQILLQIDGHNSYRS
jgi:phosphatidylserine decarboxylase